MARAGMFWALVVALAACGESRAPAPLCAGAPCPAERVVTDSFQQRWYRSIDLLFVVDDTPAVEPHRAALKEDFVSVAAALQAMVPSGLSAIHVGVVSASRPAAGDEACVPTPSRGPACGLASSERFLATKHCGRMPNFSLPFTETLPCLADLGSGACGVFQPFVALRRALDPAASGDFLAGFVRPDAYLVVVIVGAKDDASREGLLLVADTVAFLEGLKEYPDMVAVSVAGPLACGDAAAPFEAPRLKELVDAFRGNGRYGNLCGEHPLSQAIEPALLSSYTRFGLPCFVGARDMDPALPGLQAECTVVDRSRDPDAPVTPAPRETRVLPSCDVATPPCWRLVRTGPSGGCSRDSALFTVEHEPNWCPQAEIDTTISCVGCAAADDPACVGPW